MVENLKIDDNLEYESVSIPIYTLVLGVTRHSDVDNEFGCSESIYVY